MMDYYFVTRKTFNFIPKFFDSFYFCHISSKKSDDNQVVERAAENRTPHDSVISSKQYRISRQPHPCSNSFSAVCIGEES